MGLPMRCVSPKPKHIWPTAILLALRTASKNVFRILHAKYSLIGMTNPSGVKRIPSVPAGPPIAISPFLLMNVLNRSPPNWGSKHRDWGYEICNHCAFEYDFPCWYLWMWDRDGFRLKTPVHVPKKKRFVLTKKHMWFIFESVCFYTS